MKKSIFKIIAISSLVVLVLVIIISFNMRERIAHKNPSKNNETLPERAEWIVEKIDLSNKEKINLLR